MEEVYKLLQEELDRLLGGKMPSAPQQQEVEDEPETPSE